MAHSKSLDEVKRYCPKCKKRKLKVEFSTDTNQNKEGLAGWCRDCIGTRVNKRRAKQTLDGLCIEGRCTNKAEPGRIRCADHLLQNRLSALVIKGLLPEDVWRVREALKSFNGVCPICERVIPFAKWHVDHNHSTGKFRNILCPLCNRMIGLAEECTRRLQSAVLYLEKYT